MSYPRSRGYGITKTDMEASRLVFVFVRDSKPRRKVAVPVPDSATYEQFLEQVKQKLKLRGIADIYLSASGAKVRQLDELQDIDELCVVEGATDSVLQVDDHKMASQDDLPQPGTQQPESEILPQLGTPSTPLLHRQQTREAQLPSGQHRISMSDGDAGTSNKGGADDEQKYLKRTGTMKRTLQRLFPNLFQPTLPLTVKDLEGDKSVSQKRRRKRSHWNLRSLLLILAVVSCLGTMIYLFFRVTAAVSEV